MTSVAWYNIDTGEHGARSRDFARLRREVALDRPGRPRPGRGRVPARRASCCLLRPGERASRARSTSSIPGDAAHACGRARSHDVGVRSNRRTSPLRGRRGKRAVVACARVRPLDVPLRRRTACQKQPDAHLAACSSATPSWSPDGQAGSPTSPTETGEYELYVIPRSDGKPFDGPDANGDRATHHARRGVPLWASIWSPDSERDRLQRQRRATSSCTDLESRGDLQARTTPIRNAPFPGDMDHGLVARRELDRLLEGRRAARREQALLDPDHRRRERATSHQVTSTASSTTPSRPSTAEGDHLYFQSNRATSRRLVRRARHLLRCTTNTAPAAPGRAAARGPALENPFAPENPIEVS